MKTFFIYFTFRLREHTIPITEKVYFFVVLSRIPDDCLLFKPILRQLRDSCRPSFNMILYCNHIEQSIHRSHKVANPARDQLNRENRFIYPLSILLGVRELGLTRQVRLSRFLL